MASYVPTIMHSQSNIATMDHKVFLEDSVIRSWSLSAACARPREDVLGEARRVSPKPNLAYPCLNYRRSPTGLAN
jgi:hypothetical protein